MLYLHAISLGGQPMRPTIPAIAAIVVAASLAAAVPATSARALEAALPASTDLIAFESADGIAVVRPDGTGRTVLTEPGAEATDSMPVWSPDGWRIAFLRAYDDRVELWVVRADGSGDRLLARTASWYDDVAMSDPSAPSWSPDGRRIAFTRFADDCCPAYEHVWVVNADGADLQRLTPPEAGRTFLDPAWSPDGRTIALYDAFNGPCCGRARTTGSAGWASLGLGGADPAWSPAGDSLALGRRTRDPDPDNESYSFKLTLVDSSGGDPVRLTSDGDNHESEPAWSPDGALIAFERWASPVQHVVIVGSDGAGEVVVSSGAGYGSTGRPTWAPDGARLAFHQAGSAGVEVWSVDADGSDPTMITEGSGPAWRPTPTAAPPTITPTCDGRFSTIVGTGGGDDLIGTPGRDVIVGRGGRDLIAGRGGRDLICGGTGDDRAWGGARADRLLGGRGDDFLRGGAGPDRVAGGPGTDDAAP